MSQRSIETWREEDIELILSLSKFNMPEKKIGIQRAHTRQRKLSVFLNESTTSGHNSTISYPMTTRSPYKSPKSAFKRNIKIGNSAIRKRHPN